jgi:type VI secretion system protein ImpL
MNWPGNTGHVRISFEPAGESTTIEKDGSWAWFRVLQDSEMRQAAVADRYNVTFKTGNRSATFELRTNSVYNPFVPSALNALQGFRCPQGF